VISVLSCQACLTRLQESDMDDIEKRKKMLAPGIAFLSCGIAFTVIGLTALPVMLGVGPALMALGVIFIASSRRA